CPLRKRAAARSLMTAFLMTELSDISKSEYNGEPATAGVVSCLQPLRWTLAAGALDAATFPAAKSQRLETFDWMRGLACVLMFQTHCYDAWLAPAARS